ncbi:MAG: DUF6231 family protein [Spiribacter sp.]|jgi:hypothetical protein|nr:DUF6231 family protein [Spiribacter sp.]
MPRSANLASVLEQTLAELAPQQLLVISDAPELTQTAKAYAPGCTHGAATNLDSVDWPSVDLAIVDGDIELDSAHAIQLVSRLRDVYARQVLVIAPSTPRQPLNRSVLIGLGFHRRPIEGPTTSTRHWYSFDLAHYKTTPDWLNARHWANPELWDKFRW